MFISSLGAAAWLICALCVWSALYKAQWCHPQRKIIPYQVFVYSWFPHSWSLIQPLLVTQRVPLKSPYSSQRPDVRSGLAFLPMGTADPSDEKADHVLISRASVLPHTWWRRPGAKQAMPTDRRHVLSIFLRTRFHHDGGTPGTARGSDEGTPSEFLLLQLLLDGDVGAPPPASPWSSISPRRGSKPVQNSHAPE